MQDLRKLLEIDSSDLARTLRFGLHGLQASLKVALAEYASDPGASACAALLSELEQLLAPASPQKPPTENILFPPKDDYPWEVLEPAPQTKPAVSRLLNRLRDAFVSDLELRSYLGDFQLQSSTDSDLWGEIQRKLLRVPETLAKSWRERALALAQEADAKPDTNFSLKVPFSRDEILYPGLTGSVIARGLCLSASVPNDARIAKGALEGDLSFLADVVSVCLKFIELEPSLQHAFKRVYRFGVKSLNSLEEQSKYIAALTDCFRRYRETEANPDPVLALRHRLDLDEAINSLVFLPPAERDSWWGKLQLESRRTLKHAAERALNAGCDVRLRQLSGLYADVCNLSRDDFELDSGGIPGEVVACLRVYARIGQEELPGRVLFRSLR
ncbi:hypothetical protein [Kamptonema formosum]|uniref:hypothetical protein n=1 Tax=Kamptonema formosum TaxID=331992 RepID=UPI00034BEFFF|nr:hypothetical protein [Oscillatoria sp. PCC 10802]